MKFLIRSLFMIFSVTLYINTGMSQTTHTWIGGSGNFSDTNHWDSGTVPSASDNVLITGSGTYTVTLDMDATITDIGIGGTSGEQTFSMSGRIFTINGNSTINNNGRVSITNSTINGTGSMSNSGNLTFIGNTLDLPLDNAGFASFTQLCSLNAALTIQPNSTIRLYSGYNSGALLRMANGFTNHGLLEFYSDFYQSRGAIDIANGTLTNATDGEIRVLAVAGNASYYNSILAPLDNQGTIIIDNSLQLNKGSAAHLNSGIITMNGWYLSLPNTAPNNQSFTNTGTLTIDSSSTLWVNGSLFNYNSGSFTLNGNLSATNATLNFTPPFTNTATISLTNSTLSCAAPFINQGDLALTSSHLTGSTSLANEDSLIVIASTLDLPLDNTGFASFTQLCSLNAALTIQPNSTIRLYSGYNSGALLRMANGFTNHGLLEFYSDFYQSRGAIDIANGTLTNATDGEIRVLAVAGNASYYNSILAPLDNQGTIIIDNSLQLNKGSAAHLNSGIITMNGWYLSLPNTAPNNQSFTNTGTLTIDSSSTLWVNGSLFNYNSGSFTLNGNLSATNATLNFTPPFTNTATISLTNSTLSCAAPFINQGDLALTSSHLTGSTSLANEDSLIVIASTLDLPLDNTGFASFTQLCSLNAALTIQPNSTIRLYSGYNSGALLRMANGFTNHGLLEFYSDFYQSRGAIDIANGTLTNATDGEIRVLAVAGNASYYNSILAPLDNQGTIIIDNSLQLNKGSAAHLNSGIITMNGWYLSLPNTAPNNQSFTNTGTLTIDSSSTLWVNGSLFNYNSGSFTLNGNLSATNATLNFTPPFTNTATISLTNSTLSCAAPFINQGDLALTSSHLTGSTSLANEDSLIVIASTLDLPLDNTGFASFTQLCSLNAALTIQPNSTIRLYSGYNSGALLRMANGFTNHGLLEFYSDFYQSRGAIDIANGTLTNATDGEIRVLAVAGNILYANRIMAPLDNQGLINVYNTLNIDMPSSVHTNSGIIKTHNDYPIDFTGTSFINDSLGLLAGNGAVDVMNILCTNPGSISPGDSLGTIHIWGDLPQDINSTINIDIGGPTPDSLYDRVDISGQAALDGILNINVVNSYIPNAGEEFQILTFGSRVDSFRVVNGLQLGSCKFFTVQYSDTAVTLTVQEVTGTSPPVANPDSLTMYQDTILVANILINDTDPDNDPLLLVSVGNPQHGAAVISGDSTIMYLPDSGFVGTDMFIYTMRDLPGCLSSSLVTITVDSVVTSLTNRNTIAELPERYSLKQNYPNPFNPTTTINFELPNSSHVSLKIFNVLGEEVATLVKENLSPGKYQYQWNANGLASGLYFYRMEAKGFVETRKMFLMK